MRGILTYLLAGLAVTTVVVIATVLDELLLGEVLASNDPQLISGFIAEIIVSSVLGFVVTVVLFGLAWRLVRYAGHLLGQQFAGWRALIQGALAGFLYAAAVFFIGQAGPYAENPISSTSLAASLGSFGAMIDLAVWVSFIFIGLVWGAVFWMRQPKAATLGQAA